MLCTVLWTVPNISSRSGAGPVSSSGRTGSAGPKREGTVLVSCSTVEQRDTILCLSKSRTRNIQTVALPRCCTRRQYDTDTVWHSNQGNNNICKPTPREDIRHCVFLDTSNVAAYFTQIFHTLTRDTRPTLAPELPSALSCSSPLDPHPSSPCRTPDRRSRMAWGKDKEMPSQRTH
jgi:hypothetical protein